MNTQLSAHKTLRPASLAFLLLFALLLTACASKNEINSKPLPAGKASPPDG